MIQERINNILGQIGNIAHIYQTTKNKKDISTTQEDIKDIPEKTSSEIVKILQDRINDPKTSHGDRLKAYTAQMGELAKDRPEISRAFTNNLTSSVDSSMIQQPSAEEHAKALAAYAKYEAQAGINNKFQQKQDFNNRVDFIKRIKENQDKVPEGHVKRVFKGDKNNG